MPWGAASAAGLAYPCPVFMASRPFASRSLLDMTGRRGPLGAAVTCKSARRSSKSRASKRASHVWPLQANSCRLQNILRSTRLSRRMRLSLRAHQLRTSQLCRPIVGAVNVKLPILAGLLLVISARRLPAGPWTAPTMESLLQGTFSRARPDLAMRQIKSHKCQGATCCASALASCR
jgi:hypothetical protein